MRDNKFLIGRLVQSAAVALASMLALTAQAAAPGITGPSFDLVAAPGYSNQPDGATVYSWGYGCFTAPLVFAPATITTGSCVAGEMQMPGPTLIVNQGDIVSVTLHNALPAAAGNTSILFPGFTLTSSTGAAGLLTAEAIPGGTATYTFVATNAGTHTYYSGTQGDLQIEMGLYGALIVLPNGAVPTGYVSPAPTAGLPDTCTALGAKGATAGGEADYRLAAAAYDHPSACYDREYLFQFAEIDPVIHRAAEEVANCVAGVGVSCAGNMNNVATEPYVPAYFLVNGRSMPDDMDSNYAMQYPHQPYNGNPHLHPGERVLLRIIGNGRWQHPFHEHGNHVRVLARDGNLLLTAGKQLAGPALFTTTTTPGMTLDGIFEWTGRGLNWDAYGHGPADGTTTADSITASECHPDANGFYTTASGAATTAPNYFEWCADHGKALEAHPFGMVGSGGPVTLPDPNILAGGAWYGGSPYLGPEATGRAVGSTPIPPSGTIANDPGAEAGFAFMWHSHNEREITTNNAFPGGMMMMMLVDPWVYSINESN